MAKVKVYPLTAQALRAYSGKTLTGWKLGHPIDGDLREGGSFWENDTFTYRAMQDGDITTDAALGWNSKAPPMSGLPAATLIMPDALDLLRSPAPKKPKLDVSGV